MWPSFFINLNQIILDRNNLYICENIALLEKVKFIFVWAINVLKIFLAVSSLSNIFNEGLKGCGLKLSRQAFSMNMSKTSSDKEIFKWPFCKLLLWSFYQKHRIMLVTKINDFVTSSALRLVRIHSRIKFSSYISSLPSWIKRN